MFQFTYPVSEKTRKWKRIIHKGIICLSILLLICVIDESAIWINNVLFYNYA